MRADLSVYLWPEKSFQNGVQPGSSPQVGVKIKKFLEPPPRLRQEPMTKKWMDQHLATERVDWISLVIIWYSHIRNGFLRIFSLEIFAPNVFQKPIYRL